LREIAEDMARVGEGGRSSWHCGTRDRAADGYFVVCSSNLGRKGKERGWEEQGRFPEIVSLLRLVVGVSLQSL